MIELFEHNKTAYEAVCEQLGETGKACVVHPTGTGKSFIAFKWVEDNGDKRFLWLSPSENIFSTQLENVRRASDFEPENIEFMTYARLVNLTDDELNGIRPDGIIFDEVHRAGASVWQTGVERLLNTYPDAQILGLTATPVRYLDNQRDMSEELFDGCVADSMTLGEAIAQGILPVPKYVVSLYTYDGVLESYQNRMHRCSAAIRRRAEEYLEQLRRALEKSEGLDKVFAKHLTRGKYIAFCANIEHMRDMVKKVPEWFAGVDAEPHVYSVWADSPSAGDDYAAFKADEADHLRLLFCVDMFNEGIHVEGIDGVILFRPTISPIIYKQQIGRALSAMKHGTPLIIDAVNNFENLYSISSIQEEMAEVIRFYENDRREDIVDTFQIIDEVRECRELFNRLEETLSLSWESMFECARAYYNEHGDLDVSSRYTTDDGVPLGRWIATQRAVYNGDCTGRLNEWRIKQLDSIGMIWDYVRDTAWEKGYQHAKAYKEQWGDIDVHVRYVCPDGYSLGTWILAQRMEYMKLRNSGVDLVHYPRLMRLQELGMIWNKADAAFEDGFMHATRYASEHGDLNVPTKYVCQDGFKLGTWIVRMRNRKAGYGHNAPLDEDQAERLESIGMRWEGARQRQWNENFQEAERYYKANGTLLMSKRYEQNGVKLWVWLNCLQRDAKNGKLNTEQIRKLASIGFFEREPRSKSWEERYLQAKRYFEIHGDLEIPASYISDNGFQLGKWIAEQRRIKRNGSMDCERIERLNAIGMRWGSAFKDRWYTCLDEVRSYPRDISGLPIVPEDDISKSGTKLKYWVEHQQKKYRSDKLDSIQKMRWEEMINEASLS